MIYLQVAGQTFGIQTTKQEAMFRRMARNYGPFMTTGDTPPAPLLFTADIDRPVPPFRGEPLRVFDYALTEDSARLSIYREGYILAVTHAASGKTFSMAYPLRREGTEASRFPADLTIQGIAPPGHILDHLLVFALSVAGIDRGVLLIHASTVVCRERAVMFLAESGTGKSTHSRMWLEHIAGTALLNDDAPAVVLSPDGSARVYGTPWSGKTPCYRAESYPLAALVRIRRAHSNRAARQHTLQAFGALLPSCLPTLQQDEPMLDKLCNTLSPLLAATPVFLLDCLPDADAARVCCKAVFGDL